MATLYDRYLGADWRTKLDDPAVWAAVSSIPDEDLWAARQALKQRLVGFIRERVRQAWAGGELQANQVIVEGALADPHAFTIGFARRFATYKRATLLLRDMGRITRLLTREGQPVQIIFAGKAHPADEPGKALLRQIYQLAQQPGMAGRIIVLENYDMNMARYLVQGVDLWLNTPRRPQEASGTSGQKAGLNGVPSASILDGWWIEGYNGKNGWAIGDMQDIPNIDVQDDRDSRALYALLEDTIIPLYFERDSAGIPRRWLQVVREAIRTIAPAFSTRRMVGEYISRMYAPAAEGKSPSDAP